MLTWKHTGFSVDASVRIDAGDREGLLRLVLLDQMRLLLQAQLLYFL